MACCPSVTTCKGLRISAVLRARRMKRISFSLSSIRRMVWAWLFIFCFRQIDPEATAFAGGGFNPDLSPHAFDRFAHNGQADAGSFVILSVRRFLKHFENSLLMLRRDAD